MDNSKCPYCGATFYPEANFCSVCGKPVSRVQNHCENPECIRYKENFAFSDKDCYCDKCGKPTTIGKQVEALI